MRKSIKKSVFKAVEMYPSRRFSSRQIYEFMMDHQCGNLPRNSGQVGMILRMHPNLTLRDRMWDRT